MLELFQAFSCLDGRGIGECTLKFSGPNQVRCRTSPNIDIFHRANLPLIGTALCARINHFWSTEVGIQLCFAGECEAPGR